MTAPTRPGRILADDELIPAVRNALDRVNRARTWDEDDTASDWAEDGLALANRVGDLLAWLDENGIDPADPPSCGCGGHHWSCPGPDAVDGLGEPCEHDGGSTTYLRPGQGADGSDLFEDTCDTCGEVLTARTLAQIEADMPGFTAASARVGETSLPTPPGPPPTLDEDEGCPECDETAVTAAGRCMNCDYLVIPGGIR